MTATYDADLQLFIDGAWRSGEGRDERPVYNPATAGTTWTRHSLPPTVAGPCGVRRPPTSARR
jgi:hypothetical protein